MRVDDGFVLREIAGDYVIIPTGKTVLDFNGMITVNEVGVSIWKMLQEETTFENIVKGILDEYDADEETVKAAALAVDKVQKATSGMQMCRSFWTALKRLGY